MDAGWFQGEKRHEWPAGWRLFPGMEAVALGRQDAGCFQAWRRLL
jgi:hypothetical protein